MLKIEVAYAGPGDPVVIALETKSGTTLRRAIEHSGVLARCPGINLAKAGIGVFGRARGLDELVADGDRVEIYQSLPEDPKEVRRRRAKAR